MNVVNHRFENVDKAAFRNGMSRLDFAVGVVKTIYECKRSDFTASNTLLRVKPQFEPD